MLSVARHPISSLTIAEVIAGIVHPEPNLAVSDLSPVERPVVNSRYQLKKGW